MSGITHGGVEVRKTRLINVIMRDGNARRVESHIAERLLKKGEAKHYISNTVYRAMALGIEVKDPKTRDEKGVLRGKIKDARSKVAQRKKRKEKEAATDSDD